MIDTPWQALQDDLARWSDATFGRTTPDGALAHLASEVEELRAAPHDGVEYADCLLLLLDAARIVGLTTERLREMAESKLRLNQLRQWGPTNEAGFREHIKAEPSERELPVPVVNGLDYLNTCGSDGCFASNQFEREEARAFFGSLAELGARVTILESDINYDWDGPGEHYVDSCYIDLSAVGDNFGAAMQMIDDQRPDLREWVPDMPATIRLWWD